MLRLQKDFDLIVCQQQPHLHRIRSVGVTILNSHKQLNWSQRTRSNRSKCRLEIFYFALGELETVVKQWRQLVNLEDDKINKEEESSNQNKRSLNELNLNSELNSS